MIYFVSTPIGNLKDITFRAVDVLKCADVIACEDTRSSRTLLDYLNIKGKTLISYHKFNEKESAEKIVSLNAQGKNVAIISDAGMPGISDPGNILAKILSDSNIDFTVIPGANAALSALILSGFDSANFYFVGFLKEKNSERNKIISEISTLSATLIFYVSSHDIYENIKFLAEKLGNRKACLVKEITKIHESKFYFNLASPPQIDTRGEFVLIVEGNNAKEEEMTIKEHVKFFIQLGFSKNDAIKRVASERNLAKNIVYKEVLDL